jgi:dihydroorotate dehydrogenase electron transfer subunit
MVLNKKAKILSNKPVKDNYYRLNFDFAGLANQALPGQFIHVKISNGFEPLLRRPFGIHRVFGSRTEILYEVVGEGTKILSRKKPGELLDIMGPLGNGFKFQASSFRQQAAILVAGGMGVAPLTFLAEKLAERKTKNEKCKTLVLIGAKTKKHILCEKEFKKLGCEVKISTDDGSRGFKGYVSELLNKLLSTMDCGLLTIYTCGPRPMLKTMQKICLANKIPCQASFEENIACGLGACLGCAIKTRHGFKRVCYDGPVFDIKEVVL